jgi:predicted SnoaL-like aldol condensation-catalyzing enzyme
MNGINKMMTRMLVLSSALALTLFVACGGGANQEEANKKLVLDFYQQFFGDKDLSAADRFIGDTYTQHNPMASNGKEALKELMKPFLTGPKAKKTKVDFKRVAADGDLVWLHVKSDTFGAVMAVVDIFRIENGKIVEHWDVIQAVPEKSANNNTMF